MLSLFISRLIYMGESKSFVNSLKHDQSHSNYIDAVLIMFMCLFGSSVVRVFETKFDYATTYATGWKVMDLLRRFRMANKAREAKSNDIIKYKMVQSN